MKISMNVFNEDYARIGQFSQTDLAYIQHDKRLEEFYEYEPSKNKIPDAVSNRMKFPVDRNLLLRVLRRQYEELNLPFPVEDAVLLDENTFTITTSHQPTLFTGPLFHIYKIACVIRLAQDLRGAHPEHKFLPVFVMSGEDHDWAEVNHFHLFGRRYEWERKASGPCGRLSVEGLEALVTAVNELFKNSPFASDIHDLLSNCLKQAKDYGQFHRLLVASLFGSSGLIVVNLDDRELKEAFIPVFENEIKNHFSQKHVTATQAALEKKGFKIQAFCRQVNLFYMTDGIRERLDPADDGLVRVERGIKYTIEETIQELHAYPERFSPNVILRPLYQEFILPNVAYVGGGGEIAYWLERKTQFEAAGVHYPMLIRRNSLLMIDAATKMQMEKLGLEKNDILPDINSIVKTYLRKHSQSDLSFEQELKLIRDAYHQLAVKAEKMDPTLAKAILAEESKQTKQFEQLGSRLLRTEKHQQDTQLKKLQRIKEKLFPEGGLQERHENFLSIYANHGPQWIEDMIRICDPWVEKFLLVELTE